MTTGYIDAHDRAFCPGCWHMQAQAGAHPRQRLEHQDPEDPEDNFWIADICQGCGQFVKHRAVTTLH